MNVAKCILVRRSTRCMSFFSPCFPRVVVTCCIEVEVEVVANGLGSRRPLIAYLILRRPETVTVDWTRLNMVRALYLWYQMSNITRSQL